jgi:hypothetical protein
MRIGSFSIAALALLAARPVASPERCRDLWKNARSKHVKKNFANVSFSSE